MLSTLTRLLFLSIFVSCSSSDVKPLHLLKKPKNIPATAFWVGGLEGGNWYDVKSIHAHRNNAFIDIYNDQDGSLIVSKRFFLICAIKKDTYTEIEDLRNQISSFDGQKIYFKRSDSVNCWLQ